VRPSHNALLALSAFIICAALSNVLSSRYGLVDVGLGLTASAGTFTAGLALGARDLIQRTGGRRLSLAAIAVGSALSLLVGADGRIALASCAAFAVSELVDLCAYTLARRRRLGLSGAVLVSNLFGAPVDTAIFLWLSGFGLTWHAMAGQLFGKLVFATLVPLGLVAAATSRDRGPVPA
jgi:uncharacterized PurR-regulated membrane protein YhhQ (DUF165 family)